jgi:hypothetical protein
MNAHVASDQPWPNWAKALLIAMAVLAILVALPWIFMWTTMAASCPQMMNGMPGMMGPGMMR